MLLEAVTAFSAAAVVYHHAGYPVALRLLGRRAEAAPPEPPRRGFVSGAGDNTLPSVTILIPAFQEEAVIADKIRNLALLDYPADRLDVVVACDGCTDRTAELARAAAAEPECAHLRVTVAEFPLNRGKVAVLNHTVQHCAGTIVALSDASALLSVDALLLAASHFAMREVGVVCATYHLLNPGSAGEAAYWNYQVAIKEREAALGAPLGAHGAFYLLRRDLFRPLPADTINDDFILPLSIVRDGHRAVYDRRMLALELECAGLAQDQRRRRRIAAGNLQQTIRLGALLDPRHGGIAFTFASGKALRVVMPFLMLAAFAGSAGLAWESGFWLAVFAGQAGLYGIAAARQLAPRAAMPQAVDALHYLVAGHVAGMIGATRYAMGLERRPWRRTGF